MPTPPSYSYPLILTDLVRRRCLVIGGGRVAERKVAGLLEGGATPRLISPTLTPRLRHWQGEGRLGYEARAYRPGDLGGAFLVIAATNDVAVNRAVAAEAEAGGALVNVVTDPGLSSGHVPASVRRGDLLLTVSTAGQHPAFAAALKDELGNRYDDAYGTLLELLCELRDRAKPLPAAQRAALWQTLMGEENLCTLRDHGPSLLRAQAYALLQSLHHVEASA